MKNDLAIVIFTKNPEIGKVKTRLIPELGAEKSFKLYCELLNHTMTTVIDSKLGDVFIFTTPSIEHPFFSNYVNQSHVTIALQEGEDLGMRMHNAFKTVLSDYKMCLLMGADCPEIDQCLLTSAFEALHNTDVVLSPSNDGGYSLIGMKEADLNYFEKIQWSTEEVFDITTARIQHQNKSFKQLKSLIDIDEYSELVRFSHIDWLTPFIIN